MTRTLAKLITMNPEKLYEINLMGSVGFGDHIDPFVRVLPSIKQLTSLNIAGCNLNQATCRMLSNFMV